MWGRPSITFKERKSYGTTSEQDRTEGPTRKHQDQRGKRHQSSQLFSHYRDPLKNKGRPGHFRGHLVQRHIVGQQGCSRFQPVCQGYAYPRNRKDAYLQVHLRGGCRKDLLRSTGQQGQIPWCRGVWPHLIDQRNHQEYATRVQSVKALHPFVGHLYDFIIFVTQRVRKFHKNRISLRPF